MAFSKTSKNPQEQVKIQNRKILIVEDDQYTREFYHELLSGLGYEAIAVSNGQDGLDKAAQEKPDLILLDIMMPEMDGITVFNKLRNLPNTPPVIFLTNAGDTNNLLQAIEGKAAGFLIKANTEPEELLKRIKTTLRETI